MNKSFLDFHLVHINFSAMTLKIAGKKSRGRQRYKLLDQSVDRCYQHRRNVLKREKNSCLSMSTDAPLKEQRYCWYEKSCREYFDYGSLVFSVLGH